MRSGTSGALSFILAFSWLLAAPPSSAQEWRATGPRAGFSLDGSFAGLWLDCAGAGLSAVFAVPGSDLQDGDGYTVVVSIDGTAFTLRGVARTDAASEAMSLQVPGSAGELEPVVAALKAGREAEISLPAGRYALPLKGSGKALSALKQNCEGM